MDSTINFLLTTVTLVFQIAFMGCLLYLYIKTKIAGVLLIWISLLIWGIWNWIFVKILFNLHTGSTQIGGLSKFMIYSIISRASVWLLLVICSLGIMWIYHELKSGKLDNFSSSDRL